MTPQEAIDILSTLAGYENTVALILDYSVSVQDALHMAIKALEQEPCEDCISREVVIDGLDRYIKKAQSTGTKDDFISFQELVVKQLPSVTPKARWIPVSERLPEEGQSILFSTKTDEVFEGTYFNVGEGNRNWYAYRDENYAWNNVVIAWMPLPPSYQGE